MKPAMEGKSGQNLGWKLGGKKHFEINKNGTCGAELFKIYHQEDDKTLQQKSEDLRSLFT
jgi:hypothetical protein